jgi:hypothetical protein
MHYQHCRCNPSDAIRDVSNNIVTYTELNNESVINEMVGVERKDQKRIWERGTKRGKKAYHSMCYFA